MANNWYIDSGATGTAAGTSWTNAFTSTLQAVGLNAAAAWTTSVSTITMVLSNPGWVTAGMSVYDRTSGHIIGTVSSYTGTTLTLASNAAFVSSGAADVLVFGLSTIPAAGDSFFYHSTSSETFSATQSVTFPGTITAPNFLYSTDTTNSPPQATDLAAGATLTYATGTALTFSGYMYAYGITFAAGAGSTAGNFFSGFSPTAQQEFDTCIFDNSGSTAATSWTFGNAFLLNCTFKFGYTGSAMRCSSSVFKNCLAVDPAHTIPSGWASGNLSQTCLFEGVDFSALGSGKTIFPASMNGPVHLKDCKINSSVTIAATPSIKAFSARVYVSRTDGSGSVNVFQLYDYAGTETSNTSVYRSGGDADFNGNPFSKKIVTTANAELVPYPFEALPMMTVNSLVGSTRNVTVYGVWDSPYGANTPPNNNDLWIEVEYPKDSGDPMGGFVNSAVSPLSPLATGTALSTDTSTWAGTGGMTHPSPFLMTVALTAQLAGPLTIRVYAAKASSTFYIDGEPVLS